MPHKKFIRAGLQVRAVKIQFNSIRVKLTLFYTVILVLLLIVFHFIAYMLLSHGLRSDMYDSIEAYAETAKDTIIINGEDNLLDILTELNNSSNNEVFIYDVYTGEVSSSFPVIDDVRSTLSRIATVGTSTYTQGLTIREIQTYLHITPLDINTEPGKMLVVTRSADYIYNTVDSYKQWLYMAIPFVIIFGLVSGYLLSGYFLRQVKAINITAEKIDPANIIDRIPVKSNDELGRLSKTLNSLFDRIYGYSERQKQFTADASHDLRSPLTIIKAEAEVALMKKRKPEEYIAAMQKIENAADAMNDMVDDLLTLASMDSQPDVSAVADFDLSACMGNAVYDWQAPFENKGVQLGRDIAPGIVVRGDSAHFQRIVDNLVKNAFEHTPAGGSVTCSLGVSKGNIIITVADTGTGISAEHLPHIFDRFYRVKRDTPGSGLGLPIVDGTVKMYGGNISVESELGKGTIFTITIPACKAR
jgi:two-component system heavy metal sensor histidine kinase CusS